MQQVSFTGDIFSNCKQLFTCFPSNVPYPLLNEAGAYMFNRVKPEPIKTKFGYKPFSPILHFFTYIVTAIIQITTAEKVIVTFFKRYPLFEILCVWQVSFFVIQEPVYVFMPVDEDHPVL